MSTLTPLEARLLTCLVQHEGEAVTRETLLTEVWGYPRAVSTRSVDNTIMRLRAKIEADPTSPDHLKSVRGVGYLLELPSAQPPPVVAVAGGEILGRQDEARALSSAAAPLVTLVGAAGMGKTTLARRWASSMPGQGAFVALAGAHTALELVERVAAGLGIPMSGAVADVAADQVARAMWARGEGWLLLDNFEQLVAVGAPIVSRWLGRGWRLVATSRHPLGVPGEQTIEVGPLPTEVAVQLFRRRARVAVTEEQGAEVAALVEALDGMPLAIELAAARTSILSVSQLRARLGQRFRLLASSDGVALEAALEGSWELLDGHERSVLVDLALFEGSFPVEAVEAMVRLEPDGPWVVDVLEALQRHSLLQRQADGRLGLLESVRDFARRKGPSSAAHRQARWLVRATEGNDPASARRYRDELVAASRRMVDSHRRTALALLASGEWSFRSTGFPERELYDRLVQGSEGDGLVEALVLSAQAVSGQSWSEEGLAMLERAASLTADDPRVALRVQVRLGAFLTRTSRREEARTLLEAALEGAEDRLLAGLARLNLGYLRFWAGEAAGARESMEAALEDFARAGAPHLEQHVLNTLVGIAAESDPPEVAELWLERAARLAERRDDPVALAWVESTWAAFHDERGQTDQAIETAERARDRARRHGASWVEGPAVSVLALVAHQQGRLVDAEELLEELAPIFEHFLDPSTHALLVARQAALAFERLHLGAARERLARARKLADGAPLVERAVEVLAGFQGLAEARRGGDRSAALAHLDSFGPPAEQPGIVRRHLRLLRARLQAT